MIFLDGVSAFVGLEQAFCRVRHSRGVQASLAPPGGNYMHRIKRTPEWHLQTRQRIEKALADDAINGWEMSFLTDMEQKLAEGKDISDKQERRLLEGCGITKTTRLCDRPVRQKSSRRPQRIYIDGARLRRVYGNLYHLNAEEEPELPDYPKDPAFKAKYGPRGVLDCKASNRDDPAVDARFGKVGKQTCTDTGPLTKKRMETKPHRRAAFGADRVFKFVV